MATPGMRVQPKYPGTEARAGKFPGPSLIPALNAIQARCGWLPREELVALSRDVRRPLYEISGLISFYPHFRTTPPKAVQLAVCHDLACWLHDSDERIAETKARYGDDVEIEIVEVSCLGRCDIAPAAAVDERPIALADADEVVAAARARRARRGARARAQRRVPAERPVRRRRGALPRVPPRPGRRAGLRRDHRDAEGLRPARHGRRRVPDRREVGDRRLAGARAQVHDLQRGRVRAGHLQGSSDPRRAAAPRARGHDARDARDRLGGGLGLHPPRVRPRGGGAARGDRRAARAGPARRRRRRHRPAAADRDLHLARRLHPRRGVGAAGVHGGPPGRAAQQAAVPRALRTLGQADAHELGRDLRRRPRDPRARRRLVEGPGHQRRDRAEVLRDLGPRRAAGRLLRAGRLHDARPHRAGGRGHGRARGRGDPARRRIVELPRPAAPRRAVGLEAAAGGRLDARLRCGDRHGRGHGPARREHERPAVLPQRVVRQVRPLPGRARRRRTPSSATSSQRARAPTTSRRRSSSSRRRCG